VSDSFYLSFVIVSNTTEMAHLKITTWWVQVSCQGVVMFQPEGNYLWEAYQDRIQAYEFQQYRPDIPLILQ